MTYPTERQAQRLADRLRDLPRLAAASTLPAPAATAATAATAFDATQPPPF